MSDSDFSAILTRAGVPLDDAPWRDIAEIFTRPVQDRTTLVQGMTARLSEPGHATTLIRALAGERNLAARQLALELAARAPTLDAILIPWLRPLLRERKMPRRVLLDAAKALMTVTGPRGGTTARVLRDFAAGFGRLRVLHHRAALRKHLAGVGAFDRLCDRLMIVMPLRCPRCGVRRKPQSMVRHLWHRHRRLLSGRRVRSPLAWLDDWAASAPENTDALDGLAEISQWLVRRDLDDGRAESDLRSIAIERGCVVCPHCHALTPRHDEKPLLPLESSHHRLSGDGIVFARSASGIRATIEMTDRRGRRTSMPDPRGRWRSAPAVRRLVWPWIGMALIAAIALPARWAVLGAGLALTIGCLARILVRMRAAPESAASLIDAAWQQASQRPADFDHRYLARLALNSRERGRAGIRARLLEESVGATARPPIAEWAPLAALQIGDAAALSGDPVRRLAGTIGAELGGDQFAAAIESVFARLPWRDWPTGRRRRLRAAVAEQCFTFGLGIQEIAELGRAMTQFGAAVDAGRTASLALLRHIWKLRPDKPWPSPGIAATIFELAQYAPAGDELLDRFPDALLYLPLPGWGPRGQTTPLVVGERGLYFRGETLADTRAIEVHLRRYGRGYELHFGDQQFYYDRDPSPLAEQLTAWGRFAGRVIGDGQATDDVVPDGRRLERLLSAMTFPCPSCGGLLRNPP